MKARNVESDTFVMIDKKRNTQRHYKNGTEVQLVEHRENEEYCDVLYCGQPHRILREFLPGTGNDLAPKP